jgi:hypothetical protein
MNQFWPEFSEYFWKQKLRLTLKLSKLSKVSQVFMLWFFCKKSYFDPKFLQFKFKNLSTRIYFCVPTEIVWLVSIKIRFSLRLLSLRATNLHPLVFYDFDFPDPSRDPIWVVWPY